MKTETRKCTKCGHIKHRVYSHRSKRGKKVFVDENKKIWCAGTCNECKNKRTIKHSRLKYGTLPRDDVKFKPYKKGRDAENIVANHYIENGYTVKLTTATGSDIVAIKNNIILKIEVKSVLSDGLSLSIAPVSNNRINDDLIAAVYQDKILFIESMVDHLKKCAPSGIRTLTADVFSYPQIHLLKNERSDCSVITGVCYVPSRKCYRAYLSLYGKQKHLGYYQKEVDAINARKNYENKILNGG